MKKTFIVAVCVLAFTNFLFLTLATTVSVAGGCGGTTAARCSSGGPVICMAVVDSPTCGNCSVWGNAIDNEGCYILAFCETDLSWDFQSYDCIWGGGPPI